MHELKPFQQSGAVGQALTPLQTPMSQVIRSFMSGFSTSSRITMRYVLRRAAEDLGMLGASGDINSVAWHTMSPAAFHDLIEHWAGDLEPSTVKLYMHAVRGIARACYIHGLMPSDQYTLLKEIKLPRGKNRVGRGRSVELQYRQMLLTACMKDERPQGIRDAAIIAMLFGTGIRRAEVASVLDEDIDLDEAEFVVRVKGGDHVKKYLAAWAVPYIAAWRDYRRSKEKYRGALFCGIRKGGKLADKGLTGRGIFYLLEERSKLAGLPFLVRPHDGRRTMGTSMIEEHGELIAQRVLGHADLSTTRIYDKRSDKVIKDIFAVKNR